MHSKSTLRVAVEECLPLFEQLYYFPSYEIVTQYCSEPIWDETGRNPSQSSLDVVFNNFEYTFVSKSVSLVREIQPWELPKNQADVVPIAPAQAAAPPLVAAPVAEPVTRSAAEIVCDEEEIYLALAGKH